MSSELHVRQKSDGNWFIFDEDEIVGGPFPRRQEARARARAMLLERGKGSMVIHGPSGRVQDRMMVNDHQVVQAF